RARDGVPRGAHAYERRVEEAGVRAPELERGGASAGGARIPAALERDAAAGGQPKKPRAKSDGRYGAARTRGHSFAAHTSGEKIYCEFVSAARQGGEGADAHAPRPRAGNDEQAVPETARGPPRELLQGDENHQGGRGIRGRGTNVDRNSQFQK